MRARAIGLGFAAALSLALLSAAPAAAASPTPSASSVSSPLVQVPPAAPTPTSSAKSPGAPDPHPPVGGIGPHGEAVGGTALQSRGLVAPAGAPALPKSVTAAAWALVDLDSGDVLAAQDPHGRYQPASILKILTVDTLLPELPGDRSVTVSATAANTEGSKAGLMTGGTYTVDQLFSGLLLVSGNDTAMALAEAAGGVEQTVAAMNAKALALGAYDTFVQTPSGLDGWQQLTSAYDMALFLKSAVTNPRFIAYDTQPSAVLPAQNVNGVAIGPVKMTNQGNQFLTQVPGGFVSKIGFTDAALHTYVAATDRGGRRLGVVFMRAAKYPVDQWQQAADLFNWGYALPATTAVGHLDAAVVTKAAGSSTVARTSSAAAAVAAAGRSGASTASKSSGLPRVFWAGLGTLGALLVTIGVAVAFADARYRRHNRRAARL